MDSELTFKAISYGLVGLLWVTGLILSLVSIRKQSRYDEPLHELFLLTLIVIGLCTFIALCSAWNGFGNGFVSDLPNISNLTTPSAVPGLYWTDGSAETPQPQRLDSLAL